MLTQRLPVGGLLFLQNVVLKIRPEIKIKSLVGLTNKNSVQKPVVLFSGKSYIQPMANLIFCELTVFDHVQCRGEQACLHMSQPKPKKQLLI
ncbi:hypothetical protein BKE30_12630 [Alkanindiges hydrocarboniclasticus]|uniref:Uncharacterized protein n=1 Tax=Alkanindiges hydrocarboniclasticus TaxID=1907941 RepID=A0A1S8CT65_9GAMM|nr:hypothetical protein BKE30_12630 [Alkanindiges hydrocarboniclasticus]